MAHERYCQMRRVDGACALVSTGKVGGEGLETSEVTSGCKDCSQWGSSGEVSDANISVPNVFLGRTHII